MKAKYSQNNPSLKEKLLLYATGKSNVWINGGEFERLAMNEGYKASNCSRRLRELANEGKLLRKVENGSVWYRAPIVEVPIVSEVGKNGTINFYRKDFLEKTKLEHQQLSL
jgi:hypothetical protein